MILSRLRLVLSASLLLALAYAHPLHGQSTDALASSSLLPDAPSFAVNSADPQAQTQAQTPAPSQTPAAPPSTVDCVKTPAAPNETDDQRRVREQRDEAACEVKREEKQRFGGVVPQFNVVVSGQGVPLTAKEKFDISFHTIIDPYTIGLAFLVGGGIGELEDSHPGYHHGVSGLAKRIGASYADNVNGNLIGNALLPVILKQDPRYFRKGTGSIKSRIFYSAMTTFICKGDNGKTQFNTSNVAGNFISGAISNAYYPSDERGVSLTIENGITVTLEGMVGAQLLEFAPDVTNYLHKRREHHRMVLQQQADARAGITPPVVVKPTPPPTTTITPATPPNL